ncbi:unnamed protein product [Rhizoctonia solani]|uniref:Alpha-ketoglutarate-dependent dioxygenase AlkB-like domain-containing protein n=1 Tax=Rhizoctonia solani TaxID=456999 RepID=A0A8H3AL37_9AGAM|nr:unnamed protein product [Rhizoctonia solani]
MNGGEPLRSNTEAPKEMWTDLSLERLIHLKPGLFKVFIDNKAHRPNSERCDMFYKVMKEGNNRDDIEAKQLVRAWLDLAYASCSGGESLLEASSNSSEQKDKEHCSFFFYIQRSLVEVLGGALEALNFQREKLGLVPVDSDHPSLIPPELSEAYNDLIILSVPTARRAKVAWKVGNRTRRGSRAGEQRKPQTSRRGLFKGNNKTGPRIAPTQNKVSKKLSENEQEAGAWVDVPNETPQPDDTDTKSEDEVTMSRSKASMSSWLTSTKLKPSGLQAKAREKIKRMTTPSVEETQARRSSVRIALSLSLRPQEDLSTLIQQEPEAIPAAKAKSRRKRRQKRKADSAAPVSKFDTTTSSSSWLPGAGLVINKAKKNEASKVHGASDEIRTIDNIPSSQSVEFYPSDPNMQLRHLSLHGNTQGVIRIEPSLVDGTPAPFASPFINTSLPFRPSLFAAPASLPNASPRNGPPIISMPSVEEPHSFTWDDSYLTQYVRIPVWAKSRQELCELPYFKSMQGGVYTRGNTVYGYLLGRFPSPRDGWFHQRRLIISHGGGKNVMDEGDNDPNKARHQLGDDQLESDKSVRALLTAYRMFRPIVILAEADYGPLWEFNLKQGYTEGANYYVLGHYAIVAVWAEHEEVVIQGFGSIHTRWKFAFQYIEGNQGPPWWLQPPGTATNRPEPPAMDRNARTPERRRQFGGLVSGDRKRVSEVTTNSFTGAPSIECRECRTLSPYVYTLLPICLNPDCSSFWKHQGIPVPQTGLAFNPGFLVLRGLPEQLNKIPYPIVPEYPDWQHRRNGESIFNRHYWAGACCHRCGRVSCRQKWQCWECLTCGLKRDESRPQIYDPSCLSGPMDCETHGGGVFSPYDMKCSSRVVQYHDGHRLAIYYELPNNIGRIVHVLNNPNVTQEADRLFQQYQEDASTTNMFQRHAIKTHGVKGELYAQHYSHNAGAPYKYIAEAISTPFEYCPESVVGAKTHIQYLCQPALEKDVSFNEVLSVAYAEGQEMNFHSDDEPGLGPVVAGLTLGSHAEMLFRYHIACKKNLIYKNGPFRPSEARTNDDMDSNDRVLQIVLSHGDLLIMDGAEIQRQYEHAVFVRDSDMVRFAATARLIDPRSLAPTAVCDVYHDLRVEQSAACMPHMGTWTSDHPPPVIEPNSDQAEAP